MCVCFSALFVRVVFTHLSFQSHLLSTPFIVLLVKMLQGVKVVIFIATQLDSSYDNEKNHHQHVCIYIKVFILYNNTLVFINNTNSDIRTDLFYFVAFVVLFCIPDNMISFFCLWSEVATSSPAATSAIAR